MVKVSVKPNSTVEINIGKSQPINVDVGRIQKFFIDREVRGEPYEESYLVTPKVNEKQVLPTKGKYLESDITVAEIPDYEVSNQTGTTFVIGG